MSSGIRRTALRAMRPSRAPSPPRSRPTTTDWPRPGPARPGPARPGPGLRPCACGGPGHRAGVRRDADELSVAGAGEHRAAVATDRRACPGCDLAGPGRSGGEACRCGVQGDAGPGDVGRPDRRPGTGASGGARLCRPRRGVGDQRDVLAVVTSAEEGHSEAADHNTDQAGPRQGRLERCSRRAFDPDMAEHRAISEDPSVS